MIYITEHKIDKKKRTPRIEASSWSEAERRCPKDCIVIGELKE